MQRPQLSIIVPIFNERDELQPFLDSLAEQKNISFELIFCDGESTDDPAQEIARLQTDLPFEIRIINSQKGRARQMNAGAGSSLAETLLFLHVDCRFRDPLALSNSLLQLDQHSLVTAEPVAGHYSLVFSYQDNTEASRYYHMESKARLDRKECTHGDQGFLLSKDLFYKVGSFDEEYPVAEDTRLADRIRSLGRWVLFSEQIVTSARRFEVEGIVQRQTFSSILMNFVSIGWTEFFQGAKGVYATQDTANRLKLTPYLLLVRDLLKKMSFGQRFRFWYATGRYVRDNAWQIPFYFDTRYQYGIGLAPGAGENRRLIFYDKWIEPLLDHPPARLAAGFLTWLWLQITLLRYKISPE